MNKTRKILFIAFGTIIAITALIKVSDSIETLTRGKSETHTIMIDRITKIARLTSVVYLDEFAVVCQKYHRDYKQDNPDASSGFWSFTTPKAQTVSQDTLLFVKYDAKEKKYTRPSGLSDDWKEKNRFCYIFNSKTRVGIDLAKITDNDIVVSGDTLRVSIPQAEVFDVVINPSNYKIHVGGATWNDEQIIFSKVKDLCRENAINNGVLQDATSAGIEQLGNMFESFGYKYVEVRAKESIPNQLTLNTE